MGLLGFDDPGREQKFLGLWPADLTTERPCRVDPAVGCSEETESGAFAPDPYVERGGEYGATAIGKAVQHADGRLGADRNFQATPWVAHAILLLAGISLVVLYLLLDVASSRESLVASTGDDQTSNRIVGFQRLHRIEQ